MTNEEAFGIMDHYLVPLHILLTKEESAEIMEKLNMTKEQLPKIKADDPVIREIGGRPGDVVKIVRKSEFVTLSVSYRSIE